MQWLASWLLACYAAARVCVSAEGLGDQRYVLDEEYIIRPTTLRRNGAAEMKEAMRVAQGSDLIKEVKTHSLGRCYSQRTQPDQI